MVGRLTLSWANKDKALLSHGLYRYVRRNILLPGAVFTVSIGIALLGQPLIAMLSWITISPASILLGRASIVRPDELQPTVRRLGRGGTPAAPAAPSP